MSSSNRPDTDATKVIFTKTDNDKQTVMMPIAGNTGARGGETVMVPAGAAGPSADPVVGWLVVIDGPGKGQFRPVYFGQNSVGRASEMRVSIDFGDQRISREAHAFIIFDERQRKYFVRDNGKSNIVRLNGSPVLTPVELQDRDQISIGETTLLFVALCDHRFDWQPNDASRQV